MLDSFLKIMNYKSELCNGLNTVFKSAFLPCFAFGAHAHTRTHTHTHTSNLGPRLRHVEVPRLRGESEL